jgi:hypothetical protein
MIDARNALRGRQQPVTQRHGTDAVEPDSTHAQVYGQHGGGIEAEGEVSRLLEAADEQAGATSSGSASAHCSTSSYARG